MPTITVKNIPETLHRGLKIRALAHRRSLNSEVIATLEAATAAARTADFQAIARDAREMRTTFKRMIRSSQISAWKKQGRP
jgi:plasmid stability protein